ncbi:MAG: diadenylate cyclase CdaA [Bacteroidales bacterium]|nr:diadenylate cyclase CdaA [Bacteroidales bacterium]
MISLFIPAFIQIRLLDVLDVLLVAVLFYQLYVLIRGTGAINIFLGILSIYLLWWLVRLFEMELLTAILGQFISVGVLALIIVFQPEIRRFLLVLGKRSFIKKGSRDILKNLWNIDTETDLIIPPVVNAIEGFSEQKTGALIVITNEQELESFMETGQKMDAQVSEQLLASIFYKNSPLHDGAVIISNNRIKAARCVLPVSEVKRFPVSLGLRHRAALGVTEQSDAVALVVSEQTGRISFCKGGEIKRNIKPLQLKELLAKEFLSEKQNSKERNGKKSIFSWFRKNSGRN